ncbi:hypothetical protein PKF05_09270 [Fusobacterium simiae]|uniref:hypothetical protein n=1 Tax=Fusobacterium TaxID=848 RepID=UPI000409124C|nr:MULTISPECIES: hypothetical protein [Fusobacterium]MDC7956015.1 hypothetical protein [Fusobacterium simiae]
MGLMDLVKKAFLGATDEENKKNKARMREIFNDSVPNGDNYKLIYCHMENFTNAVIVEVTKHSNFIVGYKEGEVVVVPVDPDLKGYGKAITFNRKNESHTKTSMGYCIVSNPEISFQFVPITYEPALNGKGKYSVAITQSSAEVSEFKNFCKKDL